MYANQTPCICSVSLAICLFSFGERVLLSSLVWALELDFNLIWIWICNPPGWNYKPPLQELAYLYMIVLWQVFLETQWSIVYIVLVVLVTQTLNKCSCLLGPFGVLASSCSSLLGTFSYPFDLSFWELCQSCLPTLLPEHALPWPWPRIRRWGLHLLTHLAGLAINTCWSIWLC